MEYVLRLLLLRGAVEAFLISRVDYFYSRYSIVASRSVLGIEDVARQMFASPREKKGERSRSQIEA